MQIHERVEVPGICLGTLFLEVVTLKGSIEICP